MALTLHSHSDRVGTYLTFNHMFWERIDESLSIIWGLEPRSEA